MSICEKVNLAREFRMQKIAEILENSTPLSKEPLLVKISEVLPLYGIALCAGKGGHDAHIYTLKT